ncbi:hypothetical protein BURKHO8Y_20157 [Burkholderia sp. 8Y]|nr:hypothetical protein BURKHO8Y_20157 [Burkholderia sp. 8Y]
MVPDWILETIPPVTAKDCYPTTVALMFSASVTQAYCNDRPEEVPARADSARYAASTREGTGWESLSKRANMITGLAAAALRRARLG